MLEPAQKKRFVGGVARAPTRTVFVHDLLQAEQGLLRGATAPQGKLEGMAQLLSDIFNAPRRNDGQRAAFPGISNGGLAGEAALGERAGRKFVPAPSCSVTSGKKAANGGHAVVAPEIFCGRRILRAADP